MIYRLLHSTTYKYKQPVSFGNHAVHLAPRSEPHHRCLSRELRIKPEPATLSERDDFFGNRISLFTIEEPHDVLEIKARSLVELDGEAAAWPDRSMPWEEVAAALKREPDPAAIEAYQFVFESPRIRPSPEFAAYAAPSFPSGRPLAEAILDLTARIHREFHFDHKATNVRTPPEEVLHKRRGVCQDFAQLQIACLRSLQLPARYVSGYLRTYPPPGKPRLVGADASHAWVSVFCPGAGWLDVDPTNNLVPSQSHVTLAWGRDYGDVSPVRGVILGGRDHTVDVGVDLEPLE
ncbi:MAG: transglutaminase family protein [Bryobacteraceae bacterium]|jgi:transglutaminase-like putative cysteine protease